MYGPACTPEKTLFNKKHEINHRLNGFAVLLFVYSTEREKLKNTWYSSILFSKTRTKKKKYEVELTSADPVNSPKPRARSFAKGSAAATPTCTPTDVAAAPRFATADITVPHFPALTLSTKLFIANPYDIMYV